MMAVLQRRFAYRAVQEHKHFLCSGADCLLPCDRNWLPEAIGNLVKNAFDHTQQGGTIRVWRYMNIYFYIFTKKSTSTMRSAS